MKGASHENQLLRLNKIEGQIKGVKKMIEDQRYCVDILTQTKAIVSAMKKVEKQILQNHMNHCLLHASHSKDKQVIQEKIDEVMNLLDKRL